MRLVLAMGTDHSTLLALVVKAEHDEWFFVSGTGLQQWFVLLHFTNDLHIISLIAFDRLSDPFMKLAVFRVTHTLGHFTAFPMGLALVGMPA